MIERVIYSPEAKDDLKQAYRWYENREPSLGEKFLHHMEACERMIRQHPQLYPVAAGKFRHAPIRRFPYEIVYEATDGTLTIYAVFHCSQDPQKWRSRLPSGG